MIPERRERCYANSETGGAHAAQYSVGHIPSTGFNGPFDMFKPYSFQVASFVFVSGYFYKEANESHPVAYLGSRIKRLLIPLIAINAAYGCIVALLKRAVGIEWGGGAICSVASRDALY